MAYRQGSRAGNKAMIQPINIIFRFFQTKARVQFWLYEQCNIRIEGIILGFDEYMNVVLDDALERHMKSGSEKKIGRIMLKGEAITLIQSCDCS